MRKLLSLAVVLAALTGSRAAPVPKAAPAPSIEGKYTLTAVSNPNQAGALPKGGGPGGPGAAAGRVTSAALLGPAVISGKEIVLEGRGAGFGPGSNSVTMEYTLDATKTPMTVDVETVDARGNKVKSMGVAEVRGNRLILALTRDTDERPKTVDEAAGVTVYYFLKAPPPPRTEYRIVAMTVGKEEEAEKELNKLAAAGFELVNTTNPAAADAKAAPTTIHFVLKRTVRTP
jgi:hypothetical protein